MFSQGPLPFSVHSNNITTVSALCMLLESIWGMDSAQQHYSLLRFRPSATGGEASPSPQDPPQGIQLPTVLITHWLSLAVALLASLTHDLGVFCLLCIPIACAM